MLIFIFRITANGQLKPQVQKYHLCRATAWQPSERINFQAHKSYHLDTASVVKLNLLGLLHNAVMWKLAQQRLPWEMD